MNLATSITRLADQCVKCGLCLPHCPTYRVTRLETDSPRGRIALCQALVSGMAGNDNSLLPHLQHCLLCRNCEPICPSGVAYASIYTQTFSWLQQQTQRDYTSRISHWVSTPRYHKILQIALWLYQRSGLQWLQRRLRILGKSRLAQREALIPDITLQSLPDSLQTTSQRRGRIALFTGCVGQYFERETILATARLATLAGFDVDLVQSQQCCGAMAHSHGDTNTALRLAKANLAAFNAEAYDAIVFVSTGCGAHLMDYAHLPWATADEQTHAQQFADKLQEACHWFSQHASRFQPQAIKQSVLLHQPCSHRNSVGNIKSVRNLLSQLPGLELCELQQPNGCCGGAGDYALREPILAAQIRAPLLDEIQRQAVTTVVTTNIGCALSMMAGLRKQSDKLRVIHPLVLYLESLTNQ